ncbi:hypothetical protein V8C34DRAFT_63843 [Trichoderma compactum]
MNDGHDICTVSTLRCGIWADAEGVVGPMSWINTVEAQSARLCHHARNTQRNKNARSHIMNPTPTKRAGVTGPSQIDDEPGQRLADNCSSLAHATYATNHTPGVA